MPSNRLSSADQDRLIVAAEYVTKRAGEDVHPTDALVEAIDKFNLKSGEATIVANNYNVGSQVAQWHFGKSAEERLRGMPQANAAQAMSKSEKLKVKRAGDLASGWVDEAGPADYIDYYRTVHELRPSPKPPTVVKQAAATVEKPVTLTPSQLHLKVAEAKELTRETDVNFRVAQEQVRRKIAELDAWFASHDGIEVHIGTLKAACEDPVEQIICEAVTTNGKNRKHASFAKIATPLRLVRDAAVKLAAAEEAQRLHDYAQKLQKAAEVEYFRAGTNSDSNKQVEVEAVELETTKVSSVLPFMAGTQAVDAYNRFRGSMKEEGKSNVQSALSKLEDSDTQRRMNAIEVQTMIAEMMADPDSPIAGRDPEEVIGHYNNLVQIAPSIANRPAALKPFLSRSMSGEMSPFEIEQMLNMDDRVRKSTGFNPYYGMGSSASGAPSTGQPK